MGKIQYKLSLSGKWFFLLLFFVFSSTSLLLRTHLPPPACMHACMLSHVTLWTAALQAPLSMDFSRQEYWNGLPLPSPGFVFLNKDRLFFPETSGES